MLLTSSIPNLVNGISQQPATLRLASQAERQVNFLSSVADGLTMRPPSRHLAKLDDADWGEAFVHTINRDVTERYTLIVRNGQARVFEVATGTERVINAPDGWGYLAGGTKTSYRAVTVADYTFILNRDMTTAAKAELSPARSNQALVLVRGGNYSKGYKVFIDNVQRASFATPRGDNASHIDSIRTTFIATQLFNALVASAQPGFTFSLAGEVITITRNSAVPFALRVEDDSGGTLMVAVQSRMQRFSELPKEAPQGFAVEIVGDQSSSFDNYHVRYESDEGEASSTGVWRESLKGGEEYAFDNATMPHILVREADGTFTFRRADWKDREVGDHKKIPHPSFVGRSIRDIFFFRNRLGFIADENVIMSQAGEFFSFWRATATATLDSDPIDLAVTNAQVSLLNFAVPFNQSLLLFSDQSQFIMDAGDVLTPSTASIDQATSFESAAGVRPVGVGQFVYFPVPRGSFSGMREYFVQEGNAQNDALDVTSHVPRYLPRNLFEMAVSTSEDVLVALSEVTPNTIWVYKFFSTDEGKLQSSWSQWEFSTEDTILSADFIESTLYLVVKRADGAYLETLDIESGATDEGSTLRYRADRGVYADQIVSSYDPILNTTTWELPYATSTPLWVIVRAGDEVLPEGLVLDHSRPTPSTVTVDGDHTGTKVFIGQQFEAIYEFSPFLIRTNEAGGGVTANSDGRLQVRYLAVDYTLSGYFRLIVHPKGRLPSAKTFSGRRLGVSSGTLGTFNLATGRFRAPVLCRNTDVRIELRSNNFLPCSFTSAEWEATFNTRARKV